MSDSFSEIKRKQLEKQKAYLIEEYQAAQSQLSRILSDVDRIRIQRQVDDLEEQIRRIESELTQLPSAPVSNARADESGILLSLRRELAEPHIQMLQTLYRPRRFVLDDVRFQRQGGKFSVTMRGALHRIFSEAPQGQVDAVWTQLCARGLVVDQIYNQKHQLGKEFLRGRVTDFTDMVLEYLPRALTPFGCRFVQFIVGSDELEGGSAQEVSEHGADDGKQTIDEITPGEIECEQESKAEHRERQTLQPEGTGSRLPERDNPIPEFINRLTRQWLWLYYLMWLIVSALGFVASLVDVFGLKPCPRFLLFASLASLGGMGILVFSLLSRLKDCYRNWDRLLTLGLVISTIGILAVSSSKICGKNRCPSVELSMSPRLIRPGETAHLTAYASDPENDQLVYFWEANLSGLLKEGGPYQSSQNQYTAPSDSWGNQIGIAVWVDDLHCERRIRSEILTMSVLALPAANTPFLTPTPTSTSTPTPTPTPTSTFTPTATNTSTPTNTPTATPTLIPVTPIPMDLIREGCRAGKFEYPGGGLLFLMECDISQHPDAIKLSWDVSRGESFAGCAIDLPIESALAATNNTHLILWIQGGQENKLFRIGLGSTDGIEKKEIVSVATEGQVAIPLAEFSKAGVGLEHINRLIIAFEYYLGEESRRGEVCIDEVGFGTP